MLAADTFSTHGERVSSDRRELRRRSPLNRFTRNVRRAVRRTRLRKGVVSLVLAVAAVWAGYKASMSLVNREAPTPDEVGVVGRGQ